MACKYTHKDMIFYELTNIMKNALVLPSIWRYLVKILNRIFMWSCGGGCRGKLPNSVHLSTSGYVNWNVKINHCFFASSFLWRNLSLFQLNLSLIFDVNYDWLLWLAGVWSNDTLHAALEQFWIHSNARSIVSFAVSFSFTRDFTVTWIFSRLIKKKLKLHSLEMFSSNLQSQLPNLSPSSIRSGKW